MDLEATNYDGKRLLLNRANCSAGKLFKPPRCMRIILLGFMETVLSEMRNHPEDN